ncbi:hypothetical protein [Mesorhizobium sp. M0998]|uniref:hypothetical protein n=1 Tax=Mesorhizobium sp. M0998 TaxID=2957044 RepID=UPI00333B3837
MKLTTASPASNPSRYQMTMIRKLNLTRTADWLNFEKGDVTAAQVEKAAENQ